MRVDHLQQVLGERRKLVLDLELDACGEECEPLQQTFHIGVCAFKAGQSQTAGNFRKFGGKFTA